MYQVLLRIPLPGLADGIPIYGFGAMLFLALLLCSLLIKWRAKREGMPPDPILDTVVWIFVAGLIGGRILFMIQYRIPVQDFYKVWEGGLVFYGAFLGGLVGFLLQYVLRLRHLGISAWRFCDLVAPALALGLCLGRIGCLLNGCCYGNVAGANCPALHFPLSAPPRWTLVAKGFQTTAGFVMSEVGGNDLLVGAVEPNSPAAAAGLTAGDQIIAVDGRQLDSYPDLFNYLTSNWPRGKTELSMTVRRAAGDVTLPAFAPRTIGLHPTQVYESISMILLFLVLMAFYPLRWRDGQVFVLFMLGYSIHRFLNEVLRNDTDPVAFGMTLSQNGSLILITAAVLVGLWLQRYGPRHDPEQPLPPLVQPA